MLAIKVTDYLQKLLNRSPARGGGVSLNYLTNLCFSGLENATVKQSLYDIGVGVASGYVHIGHIVFKVIVVKRFLDSLLL